MLFCALLLCKVLFLKFEISVFTILDARWISRVLSLNFNRFPEEWGMLQCQYQFQLNNLGRKFQRRFLVTPKSHFEQLQNDELCILFSLHLPNHIFGQDLRFSGIKNGTSFLSFALLLLDLFWQYFISKTGFLYVDSTKI